MAVVCHLSSYKYNLFSFVFVWIYISLDSVHWQGVFKNFFSEISNANVKKLKFPFNHIEQIKVGVARQRYL